ncbi:SGNH hydrolase-type esterase domain-containing protein [Nemania sp. FL0031]|nr:SGNH hydrolase-type esterase domain-containing protein [Nemania sp. FL0031]
MSYQALSGTYPASKSEPFLQNPAKAAGTKRLRLMALGGSVTYGLGSTDKLGYRRKLCELLRADGYHVDLVGSRQTSSSQNDAHEGWRGSRIDQIATKARRSVPLHMPDIFTINAGSNDCLQDFHINQSGERMAQLLEYLWSACPASTIILSTLLVNQDRSAESRVGLINQHLRILAGQKAAENKKMVLVDMHTPEGPQLSDLVDGTHPNDEGYDKMARIWYRGIKEAASKQFIC